jgi:hypothetical protein
MLIDEFRDIQNFDESENDYRLAIEAFKNDLKGALEDTMRNSDSLSRTLAITVTEVYKQVYH